MNAEQLRTIRNTLGMTRRQFADRVGLSAILIEKIERGEWKVTPRSKRKILAALNIDETDVINAMELKQKLLGGN